MRNLIIFLLGAFIGAAIVYFVCCKPTETIKNMVDAPKGIITPEQATTLANAFNLRHKLISDSIVKSQDNRSSYYSLEDVRNYLTYAEKQVDSLGYKMDGVRLYLGAYPDKGSEVGLTTIFFVPTGYRSTADASMNFLNLKFRSVPPNIPGGSGLNGGDPGDPPYSNYPD